MSAGRPLQIKTPEEFAALADAYLAECKSAEKRPTMNGLVLALGMSSRQSLHNYESYPEFVDAVKRARTMVEVEWEQGLTGTNAAGTIFWLKNQGWTDRTEQQISGPNGGPIEVQTVRVELVRAANPDT